MIAYCLYKQQKIETLNEMRGSKGTDLSEDEIKAFIAFSSTESQLDKYRLQGESILSEMISTIENDELVRFEERMLKEYKQNIKSVLPSKLESVALSMLAAFLFSVSGGNRTSKAPEQRILSPHPAASTRRSLTLAPTEGG